MGRLDNWKGAGKTAQNPTIWITKKSFVFGGKLVPANTEIKQFETRNFGMTVWRDSNGKLTVAGE